MGVRYFNSNLGACRHGELWRRHASVEDHSIQSESGIILPPFLLQFTYTMRRPSRENTSTTNTFIPYCYWVRQTPRCRIVARCKNYFCSDEDRGSSMVCKLGPEQRDTARELALPDLRLSECVLFQHHNLSTHAIVPRTLTVCDSSWKALWDWKAMKLFRTFPGSAR